jgi:hypothetical protein
MNQPSPNLDGQIRGYGGLAVTGVASGVVSIGSIDVDGDGNPDLINGQAVIVANETHSYCARIKTLTTVAPGNYTMTFDVPGGEQAQTYLGTDVTDMVVAPANIYELNQANGELRRNTLLLASGIEDFEVEYWLDNPGVSDPALRNTTAGVGIEEGTTEFPVNDLNNPDPPAGPVVANNNAIRRVRVSLIAVTNRAEQANAASGHLLGGRPQLANRVAGAANDTFRRRIFSASVMPRNITLALTGGT